MKARLTQKCGDGGTSVLLSGNGGTWGGLFTDARRGNVAFSGFSVSSPPPTSGELAAKGFPEPGEGASISGARITENTMFKMIVGK